MANFTYILADENTRESAVIDPSWDLEKIFAILNKNGWKVKYIINTHTHFDHILGNEQVAAVTGAKIIQHKESTEKYDIAVEGGQIIEVGKIVIRIVHTPGHSKDSVSLVVDNELVLTGDTLFVGNCGRVDLPGSDASEMYHSLFEKIATLQESLTVYPGHDYGWKKTSTVGEEKRTNYVLKPRSKEEFVGFMASTDE
ncbi:MAG TPA: MBL fold metallo-hydrolase [Candidatus Eisenbacteria bacterium]|nr:MBL fold metallo-hydrolase [Candidatus Eisenbacteria bacterium]